MLFSDIEKRKETNEKYITEYCTKLGLKQNNKKEQEVRNYLAREDLSDPKMIEKMYEDGLFEPNMNAAYTERAEDVDYLKSLDTQIKGLTSLTPDQQHDLFLGAKLLYNERSIENKPNFSFIQEGDKIYLISHANEDGRAQKLEIDVKGRSLPRLAKNGQPLKFPDHREMLRVAYLSSGLMNITKDMPTKNQTPFEFRSVWTAMKGKTALPVSGSGIYFDDKARNAWGLDTQMASYGTLFGRFGNMDDVSELIHKNPEVYSDYLNLLWGKKETSTSVPQTLEDTSHTKAQIDAL